MQGKGASTDAVKHLVILVGLYRKLSTNNLIEVCCVLTSGQSNVERDTLEGSTDAPKEATLITTETLEPHML